VSLPAAAERLDTLVLPGGNGAQTARHDEGLMAWIIAAAPRSRRVVTVCTGAFLAAEAGLLNGRRVTTHWGRADQLAAEFPFLEVDADPIYLRDGKYWTSAGVTAGIDLALALVRADLGVEVAQTVARWLVMFLHRPGGQTQFATPVWVPRAERSTVRAVQTLVESAPGGDHRLPTMAAAAGMSGIDMALRLVEILVDRTAAEAAQLMIEYDPQPPFDAGARTKSTDAIIARVTEYAELRH
jgi:transcriptional regulator GlxA family with amidase domain